MKILTVNYYQDFKTISQYCAILSFAIGTLLFLMFLTSSENSIITLGLYYTLFAIGINILMFLFNICCAMFTEKYWKQYLINAAKLLINIPIAIFYLYIVLEKLGF